MDGKVLALKAAEAAKAICVSERTLFTLTKSGQIPVVQIGSRRMYRVATLEAYLARNEQSGKQEDDEKREQ